MSLRFLFRSLHQSRGQPFQWLNKLNTRGYASSADPPFKRVLVANRGEIACRIMKTCKKMGIETVAIYSEADRHAIHTVTADHIYCVGPAPTNQSYLNIENIIKAIKETGAEAVHPGYGFLSENSEFVAAVEKCGATFIGPGPYAMKSMGDKIQSKKIAQEAGVSVIPGFVGEVNGDEEILKIANDIGYPVMLKASAGGGGKGMRIAWNDKEALEGFRLSKEEAKNFFGDDRMLIEKFIDKPRHIEIQVLADKHGNAVYLNERECSIQRRNQKVVEEAPSPFLTPEVRKAMGEQACALAKAVDYSSAGTVEMLVDSQRNFYFLEMNTRLQVEHPITEFITQQDLVEHMIKVAAGEKLSISQDDLSTIHGHAIECRIYAEDPLRNFLPSIGKLKKYKEPESENNVGTVRVDAGVLEGSEISMHYDPLISKLVTHAQSRPEAIQAMRQALDEYIIRGVGNNVGFCRSVLDNDKFVEGDMSTNFIPEEYPEGFKGYDLTGEMNAPKLAGMAGYLHFCRQERDSTVAAEEDRIPSDDDCIVQITTGQGAEAVTSDYGVSYDHEEQCLYVANLQNDDESAKLNLNLEPWNVDSDIARFSIATSEEKEMQDVSIQLVSKGPINYTLCYKGTNFDVKVYNQQQYQLLQHMIPEPVIDHSNALLSPMPGLVVSLSVAVGDKVMVGQELAVVEAMKMQNLLRSQRDGIVKEIKVKAGDSVAVDEVLIEFEA